MHVCKPQRAGAPQGPSRKRPGLLRDPNEAGRTTDALDPRALPPRGLALTSVGRAGDLCAARQRWRCWTAGCPKNAVMSARGRPAMPYGWGRVPYTYADRAPWMNLPFQVAEYRERLRRLACRMARQDIACLVVLGNRSDGTNIRYLTNFEDFYGGESMLVVPLEGAPGFTTNAVMHGEPMHSGIQDCWIEDVRCAAAPRTVTGAASPATVYDHVED